MSIRVLTGIKPTGTPHLGNYVGAIRPAIAASREPGIESYFFLADYHALAGNADAERVHRSTLEVAATWLALGLDPARVHFYRQSDLPEVTELTWLLSCVTAKGLLNRAHAYKAAVDANLAAGSDADHGVGMGLYLYPVLMAADILLFNAHRVPVGRDQVQHIEIARDLAQRFNHLHGGEYFTLPEAAIEEHTAVLPGLDGRKMSKSYDNVIPLWGSSKELRGLIFSMVTNSLLPGEPKDPDSSSLFQLYQAFASREETQGLREAYAAGIGWGEAKERVFARVDAELAPARERYQALHAQPQQIESILQAGAADLRPQVRALLDQVRDAVGLRSLTRLQAPAAAAKSAKKARLPRFVQFKEADGRLNFKLFAAAGELLLTGVGYVDAKACAAAMTALREQHAAQLRGLELMIGDVCIGVLAVPAAQADAGFAALLAALAELRAAAE
jgi:tryptophanyl-tRNA synthetase